MAVPAASLPAGGGARPRLPPAADRAGSCDETADARSFVLDVPDDLRDAFALRGRAVLHLPGPGRRRGPPPLLLDVARRPGSTPSSRSPSSGCPTGVVSNWMNDRLGRGRRDRGDPPRRASSASTAGDGDLVAFAGGQRDHPGLLAGQGGPGHHRPPGPTSSTPTGTGRATIFARRAGRAGRPAPRTGSRSCTTSTSTSGFVDAGAVAAVRLGRRRPRLLPLRPDPVHGHRGAERCWTEGIGRRPHPRRAVHRRRSRWRWSRRRPPADGAPARITIELGGRTETDRPPPRHDHPADRPPARPGRAVLVRGGELRHLHGPARRGSGHHAGQQRADRRRGRRGLGPHLPVRARQRRPCASSTRRTEDGPGPDRRHHRDRAAAGPLRRGHDQGRHRGRHRRLHPRRHLQRLRRHLHAGRLPRAWWPPPRRACS